MRVRYETSQDNIVKIATANPRRVSGVNRDRECNRLADLSHKIIPHINICLSINICLFSIL